ncbi:MAG: CheW protein [Firmicutes bacterium]|nr:CheW protein [Bacillota bacterium]
MAEESLNLVVFTLETNNDNYEYGIPIEQVYEITRPGKIIKLPGMPLFIEGVMNLRDNIIPIVDLKKRFSLGVTTAKDTTRIVIVQSNLQKYGIIVDDVSEIIPLDASSLAAPPTLAGGIEAQYIMCLGKVNDRLIIALTMDKILTKTEEDSLVNAV